MTQLKLAILAVLIGGKLLANDGAFYARGNQLIPITETDISVKKEILRITKIGSEKIVVNVYYEFFNPKKEKRVLTGFEAASPSGDVNATPRNGEHPYMRQFKTKINGKPIAYQVAIVSDTAYYSQGKFHETDPEKYTNLEDINVADFNYVYYFDAIFQPGLNVVEHSYEFQLSSSVNFFYDFEYILTAARRWSNGQIDDFTLILNLGDFEEFTVAQDLMPGKGKWIISGDGQCSLKEGIQGSYIETDHLDFAMRNGLVIYECIDFKPENELVVFSVMKYYFGYEFNQATDDVPFNLQLAENLGDPVDKVSKSVLRNLPFARRGYVFTKPELKAYFERQSWYFPDSLYRADTTEITPAERQWIQQFN